MNIKGKSHPGIQVGEIPAISSDMGPEELEYRTLLQEAVLWATREVMSERKEEILALAETRIKTLIELRG